MALSHLHIGWLIPVNKKLRFPCFYMKSAHVASVRTLAPIRKSHKSLDTPHVCYNPHALFKKKKKQCLMVVPVSSMSSPIRRAPCITSVIFTKSSSGVSSGFSAWQMQELPLTNGENIWKYMKIWGSKPSSLGKTHEKSMFRQLWTI